MADFLYINSISKIHNLLGSKPRHPLITILDFTKIENTPSQLPRLVLGFYGIVFKNDSKCEWKYGRNIYDFQEGTLVFLAPGQVLEVDINESEESKNGWGLFFHADLLLGTNLNPNAPEYSFFSYEVNEALHISDGEKATLSDVLKKIEDEIAQNIDRHSQRLIVSNIELLLNYCYRYYDRQFITRSHKSNDIISRFETLIKDYFNSADSLRNGLPTVSYCADRLNISAGYLSDLLRKETGKSTLEHIHFLLVDKAKQMLLNSNESVKEIAYRLGFEYPQHFNKLFKKKEGISPAEYRNVN